MRQAADLVADGDGARVEHLLVELLLLELGELLVEVVFVDGGCVDARGYGFADFVADGVLFAEVFPGGLLVLGLLFLGDVEKRT